MPQRFDANAIFEKELRARGIPFVRHDADTYELTAEDTTITASLANVRRNAERNGDPGIIVRFVDQAFAPFRRERPSWADASSHILFAAEPVDHEFGDTLRSPVSDTLCRVLPLTDADHSFIQWVTPKMCARWGISESDALAIAARNQDALLDGVVLDVAEHDGEKLGMVPLDSPYKASVVFASSFKRLVEPELGWPVLVVIPCRDFLYVVREGSPLLGNIGHVVVSEYKTSGYPLTTEVLRLSDDGIEAIGHFPS